MQGRIKCNKCNNMIAIGTVFCPYCGSEQAPSGGGGENTPSRRHRNSHNVPIVKIGEDVMVPVTVKEVPVSPKAANEPEVKEEKENKVSEKEDPIKEKDAEMSEIQVETKTDTDAAESDQTGDISLCEEKQTTQEEPESEISETEVKEVMESLLTESSGDSEKSVSADDSQDEKKKNGRFRQKKNKKSMEYELYHDALTCCLNRKAYENKLDSLESDNYCIIVADANDLKKTNDSLGHANGDILLVAIAQSLQAVFGDANCYRTGGDEFAVILEGINEDTVKERIERFHIDLKGRERKQRENGAQIDMKAAIGYAYGKKKSEVKSVYKEADKNMYIDKHQSKQIYNPNYDSYYNDVKVQYEEMKVDFDRENLHKALLVIFAVIIFMIFYFVFIL